MIAAFGFSLLGMILWQAATPPDIAGNWTGEEWGTVVLEEKHPGKYEGSYTQAGGNGAPFPDRSGTIQVKWSRLERRFNGVWKEGDDRSGQISLRLVDDEIRGGWTTNKKSDANSGMPRLADLVWKRDGDDIANDGTTVVADDGELQASRIPRTRTFRKPLENCTASPRLTARRGNIGVCRSGNSSAEA